MRAVLASFLILIAIKASLINAAEFGSECLIANNLPTTEQCNARFSFISKKSRYDESFALSINDPIEYFHYYARYAPLQKLSETNGIFLRLPILGHTRDQFVNTDPFGDTLLFTVSAGGLGYFLQTGPLQLSLDSGFVYLKQRFANNFIHSTESVNPQMNHIYGFAQFGSLSKANLSLTLPARLTASGHCDFIFLKKYGEQFNYREHGATLHWSALKFIGFSIGLSLQYFKRIHELRIDHKANNFEIARSGIYVEFN